jgi:phospho-N-acetylmuramoyl-pentapeptide-transferase
LHLEFITVLTSFVITIIWGNIIIPVLTRLKFGQTIRSDGPKRHLSKKWVRRQWVGLFLFHH